MRECVIKSYFTTLRNQLKSNKNKRIILKSH